MTDEQKTKLMESGLFTKEQIEEMTQKRTAEKILNSVRKTGRIMFYSGDTMTIKSASGVICNTITLNLKNEENEENITFCLPNKIGVWKYLKDVLQFSQVMYQIDGNEPIKYQDSEPYKARFNR